MSETMRCGWRCGDDTPEHQHFAVLVREDGKLLGRLCPDGTTARNKIHASILSRANADRIAADINQRPMVPGLSATVIPF